MNRKPPPKNPPAGRPASARRAGGQQVVRIIGGQFRSRQLRFPAVEGLRPTGDRIRETLFNWLGQTMTGQRCLDLYAGSGALGLEALSRGAVEVDAVDSQLGVVRQLRDNAAQLGANNLPHARYRIHHAEALTFLTRATGPYDVVFLDPPFASDPWAALFTRLPALLSPHARVYVEAALPPAALHPPPPGWLMIRSGRAGAVWFALFQHENPSASAAPTEAENE